MKQTLYTTMMLVAMGTSAFAGGKYVAPIEAKVLPIPALISATPWYIGLGAVTTFIQRDPCDCTPTAPDIQDHRTGVIVRVGADYNHYLGLEGRYFKTLGEDTFSTTEHYGLYLKPQYHLFERVNIYGLLGYGHTIIDYTNGILSSHHTSDDFNYGVGFEYDLGADESQGHYLRDFDGQGDQEQGWGIWCDVQHLLNNSGAKHTDTNIITVGVTYDF